MDVLFFMRHPGHLRNFESTLRELARRGHRVHLAFDGEKGGSTPSSLAAPPASSKGSRSALLRPPPWPRNGRSSPGSCAKCSITCGTWGPPLDRAARPRLRAAHALPEPFLRALDAAGDARDLVRRSLGAIERAVPPRRSLLRYVSERDPILWRSRRCSTSARRSWTTSGRRSGSGFQPASASRAGTT